MKFQYVAALIGSTLAAIGTDCKSSASVCASGECCGTATKDNAYTDGSTANWAKDGVVRTVCNTKTAKKWVETITTASATLYTSTTQSSGKAGYVFACKATVGATTLKGALMASAALITLSTF